MSGFFGTINHNKNLGSEFYDSIRSELSNDEIYKFKRFKYQNIELGTFTRNGKSILAQPQERNIICGKIFLYNSAQLIKNYNLDESLNDYYLIIELFQKMGEDCFSIIKGEYAFYFYDQKKETNYLVRDAVGINAVYYSFHENLVFSNQLRGLAVLDSLNKDLNVSYLEQCMSHHKPFNKVNTAFEKIKKLSPGHFLKSCKSKFEIIQCQQLELPTNTNPNPNLAFKLFTQKLSSVISAYSKDEKFGSHLTGGLDSTTITSFGKHVADMENKPFSTFSTVLPLTELNNVEQVKDERKQIQETAQLLNIDHVHYCFHEVKDIIENIHESLDIYPSPVGTSAYFSLYPTLVKAKEEKLGLILSGFGGDEGISYDHYPGYLSNLVKKGRLLEFLKKSKIYNSRLRSSTFLNALPGNLIWKLLGKKRPSYYLKLNKVTSQNLDQETKSQQLKFEKFSQQTTSLKPEILKFIDSPFISKRLEIEEAFSFNSGVEIKYPFLNLELLSLYLSFSESTIIYKNNQRAFLKEVLDRFDNRIKSLKLDKAHGTIQPLGRLQLQRSHEILNRYINNFKSQKNNKFPVKYLEMEENGRKTPVFSLFFLKKYK